MASRSNGQARDEELENLIKNYSMIFMGMFEEAFGELSEKMSEVMAFGTSAIAEALGASVSAQRESDKISESSKDEIAPEIRNQIRQMFKGFREDMDAQWPKDSEVFKQFISDPKFDKGIEIVKEYDFGLARLTEKVSDEALASYILLLKNGNEDLDKMFKELSEWQATLPKPPWQAKIRSNASRFRAM